MSTLLRILKSLIKEAAFSTILANFYFACLSNPKVKFVLPVRLLQMSVIFRMNSWSHCVSQNMNKKGQKSWQFFVRIFGETMTSWILSEIVWPLIRFNFDKCLYLLKQQLSVTTKVFTESAYLLVSITVQSRSVLISI